MLGWQWLHQQIHDYRLKRATIAVVNDKQGYAARSWPLPATDDERHQLIQDIRAWLAVQITGTATPYGQSGYYIGLALASTGATGREALWSDLGARFNRLDVEQGLTAAEHRLEVLPVADHPTATEIEVYLLSLGDILKQSYTKLGL